MLLVHARWVLPITAAPIEHGVVAVQGERIAYVGPREGAPAGEALELGDAVLLPGLVNVHTHLELTAMRGFLEELAFQPWIRTLTLARRAVLDTRERLLDSARLGIAEGLRAGVTTYADTSDTGTSFEAMLEAGVRGVVFHEVFGPDPAACDGSLAELRARAEVLRARETPLVRAGVSAHAPYSVSDALFTAVAAYARAEGFPLAVHVAESDDETRLVRDGEGAFAAALRERGIGVRPERARSPVALLEATGVLAARPLLIHCVKVDEPDIAAIAAHDCAVAHCPASNAKLGHGVAPLAELLAAGVRVGLGSDSVASNNRMDLLDEARLAVLSQRARLRDPLLLPADRALELATLGGARALALDGRVGSLETGKDADLAAFPLGSHAAPTFAPETSLLHAGGGAGASFVAVAGRVLVRGGRLLQADADLPGRVQATAAALARWRAES